jgi:hypothetical protein
MSNARYLPENDADLLVWLENFDTKLAGNYGSLFGFSQHDLDSIHNGVTAITSVYRYKINLGHAYSATVALLEELKSSPRSFPVSAVPSLSPFPALPPGVTTGFLNRLSYYVTRIKQHRSYAEAIGIDLWIIVPKRNFHLPTARPVLHVTLEDSFPRIRWAKHAADGIFLYVDRRDGNGFQLIDKLTHKTYLDTAPLPPGEVKVSWDYKARYMKNDEAVGFESDPVVVEIIRV